MMNDFLRILMNADDGAGNGGAGNPSDDEKQTKDDVNDGGQSDEGGQGDEGASDKQKRDEGAEKTLQMTQAELDAIIKDRISREKKKAQKAEEEAKLREQGKYKELLEEKERELEALKSEIQAKESDAVKSGLLFDEGYSKEQVEKVKNLLEGETEEELKQSLKELKAIVPPLNDPNLSDGADPKSKGNRKQGEPTPSDEENYGRDAAKRILGRRKRTRQ